MKLKSTILIADFQKFYTICFLYIERIKNKKNFSLRVGRFLAKYVIEKCLSAARHFYMIGTWQKLENFTQSYSLLFLCLVEAQFFFKRLQKKYIAKNVRFSILKPFFRRHRCALFRPHSKIKKKASTRHSKHK